MREVFQVDFPLTIYMSTWLVTCIIFSVSGSLNCHIFNARAMPGSERSDGGGIRPATPNGGSQSEAPSTGSQRKEVDYYLNPTELFRWINYRRWDGARARVLSHPDECSTWIVSRHSSDGRILWRHLPLHLVCMQSDNTSPTTSKNGNLTEQLVDVLLDAYPEAASSPDDQGMLPIHLAIASSPKPNENILNLLLLAYPTAVKVKDKLGRTPLDLLNEKVENGPHRESSLRAMLRAQRTTDTMVEAVRNENTSVLAAMKQSASNERMASQRIIMRLEQELEDARKEIAELQGKEQQAGENAAQLKSQLDALKKELSSSQSISEGMRRERDDLINQNEVLRSHTEEHEKVLQKLHHEFEDERQEQSDNIANLRSEVSTSKAMADALESQLRSRFTNEEYLTNAVTDLEKQLADLKTEYLQQKTKLTQERDSFVNENTSLKRTVEELEKKKALLQSKLLESNKQMSGILSSHGALNSEHDRLLEGSLRTESELVENIRHERKQLATAISKQWETFQNFLQQQQQVAAEFQQKELDILKLTKLERDRSVEVITRMRQDFRDARSANLDRQRQIQNDTLPLKHSDSSTAAGTASHAPDSDNSRSEVQSASAAASPSKTLHTRGAKAHGRSIGNLDQRKVRQSDSYTFASESHGAQSFESRLPPSTTPNAGRSARQGPSYNGNLLNLLEMRAEQVSTRYPRYSNSVNSTYATSTASGSTAATPTLRRKKYGSEKTERKPRLVTTTTLSVGGARGQSSTTGSHVPQMVFDNTSRQSSNSGSNAHLEARAKVRNLPSLSLDEYSHQSGSSSGSGGFDSDSDSSVRDEAQAHRLQAQPARHRGMIRIVEEESEGESERYSRQ